MKIDRQDKDIRCMDAMDDWTEWDDSGEADWWLRSPLQRLGRFHFGQARAHALPT